MYYIITFVALFIFCIVANFGINLFKKEDKSSLPAIIFEAFLISFAVSALYTIITLALQ